MVDPLFDIDLVLRRDLVGQGLVELLPGIAGLQLAVLEGLVDQLRQIEAGLVVHQLEFQLRRLADEIQGPLRGPGCREAAPRSSRRPGAPIPARSPRTGRCGCAAPPGCGEGCVLEEPRFPSAGGRALSPGRRLPGWPGDFQLRELILDSLEGGCRLRLRRVTGRVSLAMSPTFRLRPFCRSAMLQFRAVRSRRC